MLKISFSFIISAFLFSSNVFASTSQMFTVGRDNKVVDVVKYQFWSHEYPLPVVDVNNKTYGTTTIHAEKSMSALGNPVLCTIKDGLYNPWSETDNSIEKFITLAPLKEYRVRRTHTVRVDSAVRLLRGDVLTRVIPLSEGVCSAHRIAVRHQEDIQLFCNAIDNANYFTETDKSIRSRTDGTFPNEEQWFQLTCGEGYTAFIRDVALLATPSVKEGKIVCYGKVGSADDPDDCRD